MINPRGSTGYGQKFTDEITDDWGGKVYEDLMKGTDFVLAKYPFLDAARLAAPGGCHGRSMAERIATPTRHFQTPRTHASRPPTPRISDPPLQLCLQAPAIHP